MEMNKSYLKSFIVLYCTHNFHSRTGNEVKVGGCDNLNPPAVDAFQLDGLLSIEANRLPHNACDTSSVCA